ncbi:MAG: hypothetical protein E6Q88_13330 [Lysobacteraceae bacterium]|nr:MAG: hypothetical protein E6Q88_13330 [Xanthomonadaceae bacterium]
MLIARIAYRADASGKRKFGTLLVIKPNLHQALDSDILAYARHQPRFPQQTTGDQFFDEAQWESYHRLGEDFGLHLNREWLEQLPGWSPTTASAHTADSPRPLRESESAQSQPAKPFWRIEAKDAAVGALSLGALLTLALPAWQAYENFTKEREAKRQELVKLVTEVEGFLEPDSAKAATMPHRWSQSFKVGRLLQLGQEFGGDSLEATMSAGLIGEIRMRCVDDAGNRSIPQICGHVREPGAIGGARRDGYWSSRSVDARMGAMTPPRQPQPHPSQTNPRAADEPVRESASSLPSPVPVIDPKRTDPASADSTPPASKSTDQKPADQAPFRPLTATGAQSATQDTTVARRNALKETRAKLVQACGASEEEQHKVVLYLQVYDEASRDRMIAMSWDKITSAVQLPGVENVTITAATRNDDPPMPYASPTLLVHRWDQDQACARALRTWLAAEGQLPETHIDLRRLPGRFKGRKRVIELWWPSQHRDTSRW